MLLAALLLVGAACADPRDAVRALIDRQLGNGTFSPKLELIDATDDGRDVFEIDGDGAAVVLRGSSGVRRCLMPR